VVEIKSREVLLVLGAAVIAFSAGYLVANPTQQEQTVYNSTLDPSNAISILNVLSPGRLPNNLMLAMAEKLPGRCARFYFLMEADEFLQIIACPKDLSPEEIEEISEYHPYPMENEGRTYSYVFSIDETNISENDAKIALGKFMWLAEYVVR
jgi:hypothetical protein